MDKLLFNLHMNIHIIYSIANMELISRMQTIGKKLFARRYLLQLFGIYIHIIFRMQISMWKMNRMKDIVQEQSLRKMRITILNT